MEKTKTLQRVNRTSLTKAFSAFQKERDKAAPDLCNLQVSFSLTEEKIIVLRELSNNLQSQMIENNSSEEDISKEIDVADEYERKFYEAKFKLDQLTRKPIQKNLPTQAEAVSEAIRGVQLPKIELKKFGGEIKDWLPFWNTFKKIHDDSTLSEEDKFHYLLQSMIKNSRAYEVVNSYPPTAKNYTKAVQSLESRFGKNDLLIEYYVRELLKLVLNKNKQVTLLNVYDKLETHLRALEFLEVTTDMCAAMLFPLVESSLPEEILRAWQRTMTSQLVPQDNAAETITAKVRLTNLMTFLGREVEGEERIQMAKNCFEMQDEQPFKNRKKRSDSQAEYQEAATAAGLLTMKETNTNQCLFCEQRHDSRHCETARSMTLDERVKIVKNKRGCFKCLKIGHSYKKCNSEKCSWCKKGHCLLMCRNFGSNDKNKQQNIDTSQTAFNETSLANAFSKSKVFLPTLKVIMHGPNGNKTVKAVIDTGSHRSYVLDKTARELGYSIIGEQTMVHLLFGGAKSKPRNHEVCRIHISNMNGKYKCDYLAFKEDTICQNIPNSKHESLTDILKKKNIELSDSGECSDVITLLIGSDVAGKLFTGKVVQLENGLTAIEAKLGWTLLGKDLLDNSKTDAAMMVMSMFTKDVSIVDLWSLDTIGIKDPIETASKTKHNDKVRSNFNDTTIINDEGRYEILLPWKENHPPLQDNKLIAVKRLMNVTKRLQNENLQDDYNAVFENWMQLGIIEKVPASETENRGFYLPHRHVIKEGSTTRIRPVFDASVKSKDSPSLNQCLETGPNLIELIPRILHRFRGKRFGVTADITKAFLQISVAPSDRDVLRFLWWNDKKEMVTYRHRRVVFGVSSSPFLLSATIEFHLMRALNYTDSAQKKYVYELLLKSFYVDDCITSLDTVNDVIFFQNEATSIMLEANFELRGWNYTRMPNQMTPTSVLGLVWDTEDDTLSLTKFATPIDTDKITKRNILSSIQKVYDPLGFVCPILLKPKLILQKFWTQDLDWDSEVDPESKKEFIEWQQELYLLRILKIPRHIFCSNNKKMTLHCFVDASQNAYAAVIYARFESENGVKINLIEAKSRIAPKNKKTIPRLELLAATIGARLMLSFEKSVKIDNSEKYVPGNLNPADLPTRGCSVRKLLESKWWEGPVWLRSSPDRWPQVEEPINEDSVNAELRKTPMKCKIPTNNVIGDVVMGNANENCEIEIPWYLQRYSDYIKNVRMVAWMNRFIKNCKRFFVLKNACLTAKEFSEVELILCRLSQKETFKGENDIRLKGLNVVMNNDGLLRTKTVIINRQDDLGFRCPIILDGKHLLTKKMIEYEHVKLNHANVSIVMNKLREKFWILQSRRAVRSVVNKCITCRRFAAKEMKVPPASLPENRVRDAAVFEITGIDYAGPLFLSTGNKAYVCLFTCAVYRAIHLELATSLSTEEFLGMLRRFIARRGRPSVIYSDNGKNFVGAFNLFRSIDWKKISDYCSSQTIEWNFNPPLAPWWGGWWERLIRILKDLLRRTLRKASLNYEELYTVLCDCEAVINSRPLTYMTDESNEVVAISPSMFLRDIKDDRVPDLDFINKNKLAKRLRYQQRLREELRKRFRMEYLGQLMRHQKYTKNYPTVSVGDIVLVGNEIQKRLDWPLAQIKEVLPGRDGNVRVVKLHTANGDLIRPVQRLIPLEVGTQEETKNYHKSLNNLKTEEQEVTSLDEKVSI